MLQVTAPAMAANDTSNDLGESNHGLPALGTSLSESAAPLAGISPWDTCVAGTVRLPQSQPVEPQDAFGVGEQHLDLLPLAPRGGVGVGRLFNTIGAKRSKPVGQAFSSSTGTEVDNIGRAQAAGQARTFERLPGISCF